MSSNALTQLPPVLQMMAHLQRLSLAGNPDLVITTQDVDALLRRSLLPALRYLVRTWHATEEALGRRRPLWGLPSV